MARPADDSWLPFSDHFNQHFDMHGYNGHKKGYGGDAGQMIDIRFNTVRGEQEYGGIKTRPAFWLRGNPTVAAYFGAT